MNEPVVSIYEKNPVEQLKALIDIINETFPEERAKKLNTMYEYFAERIIETPASGKKHYHLPYPGGYLDHIHNVINASLRVTKVFKEMGGIINFTKEELIFAAMHHDLGKLGTLSEPYYVIETSDWHIQNNGAFYKINTGIQPYMTVPDRALYLLQYFDIKCTENETLGIKLADGLYDEGNGVYLKSFNKDHTLGSALPYILHWGDHISCQAEKSKYLEIWKNNSNR